MMRDIFHRRAKIIDPVEGWVSIKTELNEPILELTIAPDKQTQIAQMERRFEKLKAAQQDERQSESPTELSSASAAKLKLTFKSSGGYQPSDSNIPKLSGPGTKKPPSVSTKALPHANLLDLDSPQIKKQKSSNELDSWFS